MKKALIGLVMSGLVLSLWLGGCSSQKQQGQQPSAVFGETDKKPEKITTEQASKAEPAAGAVKKEDRREGAGHLVADKMDHDFGMIEPGEKLYGKYTLTNDGKETLEVDKIGKSCGCTEPKLDSYVLKPGESTTLSFSFKAGSNPGKVKKNVWVTTRAPSLPDKLTLTLSADIRKIMDIKPERLSFDIKESASNKGTIVLTSTDGKPFKVTGCTSTGSVVDVTYDADKEATEHTLTYAARTDKLRESATGLLSIKTSSPKAPDLTVHFDSVWPFSVYPTTKHFRKLVPGQTETSTVKVVSNFGEPFELGEISSKRGLLSVASATKTEDGYQVEIAFSVPADSTKKYVSDILTINIKDHPGDSVEVRCYSRP
jgi:hypothetical protein